MTTERVPEGYRLWDTFSAQDIPDDIASILQYFGDQDDDTAFRTGDIVAEMFEWAEAERLVIPKMRMYAAVGYWRKKSAETIRTYYYVSKNVPSDVRFALKHEPAYQEICFGQVKSLVPVCHTSQDYLLKLNKWLDYCAENSMGTSSVDGMRRWLKGDDPDVWVNRARRMLQAAERIASAEENVPEPLRKVADDFHLRWSLTCGKWGLNEWDW